MKKIILILSIATFALFFVSCGEQVVAPQEDYEADYDIEVENPVIDAGLTLYTMVETDYDGVQRIFPPGTLSIEHFLEDIDYMMYVLENNFALLEVAYWAWEVDAWALAENARADVLAAYEAGRLCEDMYLALLRRSFFPLIPTGHFDIFTPGTYHAMVTNPYGGYRSPGVILNNRLLETPLALRFYEYRMHNLDQFAAVLRDVMDETENVYNRLLGDFSDLDLTMFEPHSLTTKVLEEKRIAYISVNSFLGVNHMDWHANQQQIFDFYVEINDFDHLIIDLRNNRGGNIGYFINNFLRPHLEDTVTVNSFHFFMDGPYIRRLGDAIFARTISNGNLIIPSDYRPVYEIISDYELPELRIADMERLHYGTASSTGRIHATPRHAGVEIAFPGKIWMLTNERMFSAAQAAARISMETNFATHVGEKTGGSAGGLRALALLPNTGIAIYFDVFYLTDSRGRPLEAGTIPHHFNRPGMDALHTTLALIAEGEY